MGENADTRHTEIKNPFTPGIGKTPPVMGVRPHVDDVLNNVLAELKRTDRKTHETDPDFLYLYGPRGNGKTVQLRNFENQAQDSGIRTLILAPGNLQSDDVLVDALATRLCDTDTGFRKILQNLPLKGELSLNVGVVQGVVGLHRNRTDDLQTVLQAANCPLLITLDEAHTEDVHPGTLKSLMDAVQIVGRTTQPTVLALAGTPSLKDRLRQTKASYWSRGQLLPIGRLPQSAAMEVVAHPLQDTGIACDMDAIKRLTQVADSYPYFLQLYGRAAFNEAVKSGTMKFGATECAAAIDASRVSRETYYAERLDEFIEDGEPEVARFVARAFRRHGDKMNTMQVKGMLDALDPDRTMARWRFLRHKGYIWEGTAGGIWEPGIPSLMDYMIEQTDPTPTPP